MSALTPTHVCGNCGRYTAVVDGWARDYEADGFTVSERVHACTHGEAIGHPVDA